MILTISGLKKGAKIKDSLFKPGKDVKISKFGDMGSAISEGMKKSMEDDAKDSADDANPAADLMKMFGQ